MLEIIGVYPLMQNGNLNTRNQQGNELQNEFKARASYGRLVSTVSMRLMFCFDLSLLDFLRVFVFHSMSDYRYTGVLLRNHNVPTFFLSVHF